MRKAIVALVVFTLLVSIPIAVIAVELSKGSRLDHQVADVRSAPVTTSSTSWVNVPGLQLDVCAKGWTSATVSAVVSGAAPVYFRVLADGVPPLMSPPSARFVSGAGMNSFSFTFVGRMGTFEGSDGHLFDVQWRSPTGGAVTFHRGTMNILFGEGSC
jgi:hypothetical protein